jgi:hypothetical protein
MHRGDLPATRDGGMGVRACVAARCGALWRATLPLGCVLRETNGHASMHHAAFALEHDTGT